MNIHCLLPDGNTKKISIKNNDEVYYRNIVKELELDIPDEFVAVYDLKQNRVISKFVDKLEATTIYKVFYVQQALSIVQSKEQDITKYKAEIDEHKEKIAKQKIEIDGLKETLNTQQNEAKDINNKSVERINTLEEKLNEVQQKLQVAENKVKEQRKDLDSAQYDLKMINSQQDMYKQDMIKKLQQKDAQCDQITQLCQKYYKENENLQIQFQQSRQSVYQIQEQFQSYQQQLATQLQQWQQYAAQLESEKKIFQLEKSQQDSDLRKFKKEIEKYEDDLLSKQSDIGQLRREKHTQEIQITTLKKNLQEEEERGDQFSRQQKKYEQEIDQKSREIIQKNQEIQQQQEKLENMTQKYTNKLKEVQNLQDKQNQQNVNNGLMISEEIQSLQKQLNQENDQNEKLSKGNEELQKKLYELQANLNKQQLQINELNNIKENLEKKLKSCQDESKQDLNYKQQQIEQYQQQLQIELNNNQENLQKCNQKHEEDSQIWKEKESNYEKEIQRLKETLEKVMNEKIKYEDDASKQRQDLLNQINDLNAQIFQKDFELIAIQNSAIVPVYQFRIQRLVEQVPREYNKDIEFAIETMMLDDVKPENFLKDNEDKSQKLTYTISQIQLNKAKAESTLYNISDQDYRKCAEVHNIGKITGIQCFVPINSSETSLDRYFFFKCLECPNRKQFEGKIFGIKQSKKQDVEDLETKETAIDNCLSTVIAQDVMNKFVSELQDKKANNILEFKFRDQFIIETTKDFKQVLSESINQQLVLQNEGIKNYVEFIEQLNGEQSNEFYDFTREYSTDKSQPKDGNIIQAFLKVYNDQKLVDTYAKFNPENIRKQLSHFIDFIGGNMKEMPQKLYYSIQEIEINPEFQKYNGGHMKFDTSQQGKFLSAFTYYSIVKSQRQMCVSHLQGVKNQLYDPLVSTYDGFLDKMDQGYNEIRTVESKFLSEANLNKGIDYMQALGIKWK